MIFYSNQPALPYSGLRAVTNGVAAASTDTFSILRALYRTAAMAQHNRGHQKAAYSTAAITDLKLEATQPG